MPRIPYIPDPSPSDYSSPDSVLAQVRQRRLAAGHDGLLELDRMLLHTPPIAEGWNAFLGAVRTKTGLDTVTREIIICRVAILNGAEYEWGHHAPLLKRGLTDASGRDAKTPIDANRCVEALRSQVDGLKINNGTVEQLWLEEHEPLLDYVDAMTKNVKVSDEKFQALRQELAAGVKGDRMMVEITSTCAAYNCVSRFLVALNVGDENPQ